MPRLALSLVAFALLISVSPLSRAADPAQIKHLRVGGHAKYDRLVLELDQSVRTVWGAPKDPHAPIFEIAARPLHPQVLDTALKRLGKIYIEEIPAGTRIRFDSRRRRIRVFELQRPPRLVIDIADPGTTTFAAPRGTKAILAQADPTLTGAPTQAAAPTPKPARTTTARAPSPKPASRPAARTAPSAKPKPAPAKPPATLPKQTAQKAAPQTVKEVAPQQAARPEAKPVAKTDAKTVADAKGSARRSPFDPPTRDLIQRSLDTEPLPDRREPETVAELPEAAEDEAKADARTWPASPSAAENADEDGLGLWIGLGALGLVALLVLVGMGMRRMRGAGSLDDLDEHDETAGYAPETITPEELYRDHTRVEFLDKRLDEEVRARMQLEEKMVHANDELKVMRDRLARLERRRGA